MAHSHDAASVSTSWVDLVQREPRSSLETHWQRGREIMKWKTEAEQTVPYVVALTPPSILGSIGHSGFKQLLYNRSKLFFDKLPHRSVPARDRGAWRGSSARLTMTGASSPHCRFVNSIDIADPDDSATRTVKRVLPSAPYPRSCNCVIPHLSFTYIMYSINNSKR